MQNTTPVTNNIKKWHYCLAHATGDHSTLLPVDPVPKAGLREITNQMLINPAVPDSSLTNCFISANSGNTVFLENSIYFMVLNNHLTNPPKTRITFTQGGYIGFRNTDETYVNVHNKHFIF